MAEPRYLRRPWAEIIGRLDEAQYPVEVVQHPECHAASAMLHNCSDKNLHGIAFAMILVADIEDILTYRQV